MHSPASSEGARIDRATYTKRFAIYLVSSAIGVFLLLCGRKSPDSISGIVPQAAAGVILLSAAIALFSLIVAPRTRDVGLRTTYCLLLLVPAVGIVFILALMFIRSDAYAKHPNPA